MTTVRPRVVGWIAVLAALLALIAACAAPATPVAPTPTPAPEFDLAHVKATWIEDCETTHDVTDAAFCADVRLSAMTADHSTLNVPTTLGPNERARGVEICQTFAGFHFDADAKPFGYFSVYVSAADAGYLATCTLP